MSTESGPSGSAKSSTFRQVLEAEIDSQLGSNFTILGSHPDAKRIIIGVICVESGQGLNWKNVSVRHALLPATAGIGKAYEAHDVVRTARKNVALNQTNLNHGRMAQSLLGCLGAYLIRGLNTGRGFPHIQNSYNSLAESIGLLVDPGQSITALFTEDEAGLRRGLVSGMCILEYNYKIFLRKLSGDKQVAMQRTIRAHLGDPNSADAITGISGGDYLARVMNNANSASSSSGRVSTAYSGTSTNTVKVASTTSSTVINSDGSAKRSAPGCTYV